MRLRRTPSRRRRFPWRCRLAVPWGNADLRNHGTADGRLRRRTGGPALSDLAGRVRVGRYGPDVRVDGRLSCSPLAEGAVRRAPIRPPRALTIRGPNDPGS